MSSQPSYRAAIGPGSENTPQGVRLAVEWVSQQQRELGGSVLVLLPQMSLLPEHPGLQDYARAPGVTVGTKRNGAGSGSPVVLAAWPTEEDFAAVLSRRSLKAVCLLPWSGRWASAWAAHARPVLLGTVSVPPVEHALNPVVRVALTSLAELGDFGTLGRGLRKSTIKRLADAGYTLPREQVLSYLVAEGMSMSSALDVAEHASRASSGVKLREPSIGALHQSALHDWQREAASSGGAAIVSDDL